MTGQNAEADITAVKMQEAALRLDSFSPAIAWQIGCALREVAAERRLPILIDIRTWDRQLFAAGLDGASADNAEWVRRKSNVVNRFQMASYRKGLELAVKGWPDADVFGPGQGIELTDYAPHGGAFPIALVSGLVIGAITVSGLPQREDHNLVVDVLASSLGRDVPRLG